MPPLTSLALLALCLYPALFVAVIIHELGHALFARVIGYRVTSFGLGTGKPFFRTTFHGGMIFFLCRDNPTLGTCWTTTTELLPSRFHRALLIIGGGIANLLVAAICFVMLQSHPGVVMLALAVMNALIGLANLIPFRQRLMGSQKTVASDGLQAVSLFLLRHARAEIPQAELGFRTLWEEIGDTHTLRYRLFLSALAAHELEAKGETARYQAQAEALSGDDTDAHLTYLRGRIALRGGDRESADKFLRVARYRYEFHRASGSVFLCDLYSLFTQNASDASKNADAIARSSLIKRADVATRLAATRLLLFTQDNENGSDVATLETLLARYESARRHYRTDIEEAAVYEAVSQWRRRNGDEVGASIAREHSEKVMHEIVNTVSTISPLVNGR